MGIQLSDHFTYKKLIRFVMPSVVMMIFTSIYGVVDGFFISNYDGKTPFAAVNLIMPFLMILGALGFMFGTGGSSLVALRLGEGKQEEANRIFSLLVYTRLYKNLGEGINVSGGEAQKIAIARALYKDAPFVIMDEPTAALDPIAEAQVYENFNDMIQDKTAIFISHRMSSCKFCDEIVVLKDGEITQRGSHETLLTENGLYRELWNAQAQYYGG